jgi:hypothetical protein
MRLLERDPTGLETVDDGLPEGAAGQLHDRIDLDLAVHARTMEPT